MHVKKFTRSEIAYVLNHNLRKHIYYSNENINTALSCDNIEIIKGSVNDIDTRLKNVYMHGRNGKAAYKTISAVSICIHKPLDCRTDDEVFFTRIADIYSEMFGKENVISAVVHRDEENKDTGEVRPHMHFVFVPVVKDKKKNREKLCAKAVVNRSMLKTLHGDVERLYEERYGEKVTLQNPNPNERLKKGNIEHIEDYKKVKNRCKQLEMETANLRKRNAEFQDVNDMLLKEQNKTLKELDEAMDEIDRLKAENDALQNEINHKYSVLGHLKKLIKKCLKLLRDAEEKDIQFVGHSPITEPLKDLQRRFDEIDR